MNLNIPENLDHLDVYSPEVLGMIIIREVFDSFPDLELIQGCIQAGASLDTTHSTSGWTALHIAAGKDHLGSLQALITAGASLDVQNYYGWTALHFAAYNSHPEIVKALINAGASKDAKNITGRTPWDFAPEIIRTQCPELKP